VRYRDNIPLDALHHASNSDGMLIGTLIFSVITGIIFIMAGKYGKQFWLFFWGIVHFTASLGTLIYVLIF
jgi:hypothetical protein